MRVRVDKCFSGHHQYHFRCTVPDGTHYNVGHNSDGNDWCRAYATEMRDQITRDYDVKRSSIKVIYRRY